MTPACTLDSKEEILSSSVPRCRLERIRCDLSDVPSRREVFSRLQLSAGRALILTEGVLLYLSEQDVGTLVSDLSAVAGFDLRAMGLATRGRALVAQDGCAAQAAVISDAIDGAFPRIAPRAARRFRISRSRS